MSSRERAGSSILSLLGTVALAVVIAVLLRTFVVGVYQVPSGSMLDRSAIQIGDLLVGVKRRLRRIISNCPTAYALHARRDKRSSLRQSPRPRDHVSPSLPARVVATDRACHGAG